MTLQYGPDKLCFLKLTEYLKKPENKRKSSVFQGRDYWWQGREQLRENLNNSTPRQPVEDYLNTSD